MTKLSVNINKIATLRNARGGNMPNLLNVSKDIEDFGAQGITIHPRPDERHIKYNDARALKSIVTTEYNIEGNPNPKFIDLVLEVKPTQVTLVPDAVDAITSNAGWDTEKHFDFLKEVIDTFKKNGIRTSIFVDPNPLIIEKAAEIGTDRIELYTESFAKDYAIAKTEEEKQNAVRLFNIAAKKATEVNLGINAGHDLSLDNIQFFKENTPNLLEVSIGHALICESLYFGLENVINMYLNKLK
ncbi:pyridoxine 5'-phosphate synthase [Cellulophaga sp. HaHaR_3_176]|uniref:pyridoxine 5'-phosphate synthase n=1 Tax=Cellulophaga sp. HaHaR_3_176 TaxID=1942464 RepID=UPI001C1F546E|nr:pyridoxine 5'-phosphate synthase [Cellulophaga sp. HaHaR_3_176]QWX84119.1 pyridoxine 5'-phosphate synthase [Cellulophaga sp. HaHaR_3_176]